MTADCLPRCLYCGERQHVGTCPRVSALEYEADERGIPRVRRVEFHDPRPRPRPPAEATCDARTGCLIVNRRPSSAIDATCACGVHLSITGAKS